MEHPSKQLLQLLKCFMEKYAKVVFDEFWMVIKAVYSPSDACLIAIVYLLFSYSQFFIYALKINACIYHLGFL